MDKYFICVRKHDDGHRTNPLKKIGLFFFYKIAAIPKMQLFEFLKIKIEYLI